MFGRLDGLQVLDIQLLLSKYFLLLLCIKPLLVLLLVLQNVSVWKRLKNLAGIIPIFCSRD